MSPVPIPQRQHSGFTLPECGYGASGSPIMHVTCERCGARKATLEGHHDSVVARVTRLIDRNLRVGDWRKSVERKRALASNE